MVKHTTRSSLIHRSLAFPVGLVLLLFSQKCDHPPKTTPPPDVGAQATQALQMIFSQSQESQNFVGRFKGKSNSFTPQQIEFAQDKYAQTLTAVNSLVDEIKSAATGSPTLTDDKFMSKAKDAIDSNVALNTLMEQAVDNTTNFDNFVLMNANKLPDSWTTLWRAAPSLSQQQKQQLQTFLESSIRYKSWDVIKKK